MATPKTTATLIGIVAIFFAGLAAYLVYDYIQTKEHESSQARMDVQKVAVAATDLGYGTRIRPEDVKMAEWPKTNLPAGHKTSVESLNHRLTTTTIKAGSPILETSLAPVETEGGIMPYLIPPGSRAFTVAVNEVVGVAGFVLPNSIVDVVATVNSPYSSRTSDQRVSKIILQNVKVLAVAQMLEQKEGKPVVVPTVTLQVKPDEAEKLALASENKVQLILRNMGDSEDVKTKGATIGTLLGGAPPAKPTAAPASSGYRPAPSKSEYVEVIKGSERSKVQTK